FVGGSAGIWGHLFIKFPGRRSASGQKRTVGGACDAQSETGAFVRQRSQNRLCEIAPSLFYIRRFGSAKAALFQVRNHSRPNISGKALDELSMGTGADFFPQHLARDAREIGRNGVEGIPINNNRMTGIRKDYGRCGAVGRRQPHYPDVRLERSFWIGQNAALSLRVPPAAIDSYL